MPTYSNPIPRDSDVNNASEAAFINNILGTPGGIGAAFGHVAASRNPFLFDHFLNSGVPTAAYWAPTATGTTGNDVPATAVANAPGGNMIQTSGTGALEAQELGADNVGWKPSTMGPLFFEARAKVVGVTEPLDGDFSIGMADAITYTSGVPFIIGASSLYTTDLPVEFAGFNYTSLATSGTYYAGATATPIGNYIGVHVAKNGTGNLALSSGVRKDSGFHVYGVAISTAGDCTFYLDFNQVAYLAAAITPTVALTPYLQNHSQASHENAMTIDYIGVGGVVV